MQMAGVLMTAMAFASFTAMDTDTDHSAPQDALQVAGYVLCGAALILFIQALRVPER